jgi:transcriptional regulator with XRE-family HTH domain
MSESELIARAADRARGRSTFVASVLAQYQHDHGMSQAELANQLECAIATVDKLALCRNPQTIAELEAISHYTGIATEKLGEVVPLSCV